VSSIGLTGSHLFIFAGSDFLVQWIERLLPGRPGYVGRDSELGNRLFVEAVIWKFRTGIPWRDLPTRFGAWKNIHTRFSRWAIKGFGRVFSKRWGTIPTTNTP